VKFAETRMCEKISQCSCLLICIRLLLIIISHPYDCHAELGSASPFLNTKEETLKQVQGDSLLFGYFITTLSGFSIITDK